MGEPVSGVRAGQFAVVTMADGRLKAVRVSQVWEPGEDVQYFGHSKGPAEVQMVSLEKLCLTRSSCILRVIDTESEAKVFALERELEEVRSELLREREAHARSRDRLRRICRILTSVGTVLE
jgi:hypothetical protein